MTQARLKPPPELSQAMRSHPDPRLSSPQSTARGACRALGAGMAALVLACLSALSARAAQPFIWDQDGNGIDDRVESVHAAGFSASFEFSDTTLRQRIDVVRSGPDLLYGVYVEWDHEPTQSDYNALTLLGMPVLSRIEA